MGLCLAQIYKNLKAFKIFKNNRWRGSEKTIFFIVQCECHVNFLIKFSKNKNYDDV